MTIKLSNAWVFDGWWGVVIIRWAGMRTGHRLKCCRWYICPITSFFLIFNSITYLSHHANEIKQNKVHLRSSAFWLSCVFQVLQPSLSTLLFYKWVFLPPLLACSSLSFWIAPSFLSLRHPSPLCVHVCVLYVCVFMLLKKKVPYLLLTKTLMLTKLASSFFSFLVST